MLLNPRWLPPLFAALAACSGDGAAATWWVGRPMGTASATS